MFSWFQYVCVHAQAAIVVFNPSHTRVFTIFEFIHSKKKKIPLIRAQRYFELRHQCAHTWTYWVATNYFNRMNIYAWKCSPNEKCLKHLALMYMRCDQNTQKDRDQNKPMQWSQNHIRDSNGCASSYACLSVCVDFLGIIQMKTVIFLRSHIQLTSHIHYQNMLIYTHTIRHTFDPFKYWEMNSRKSRHKRCWKSPEICFIEQIPHLHHDFYARTLFAFLIWTLFILFFVNHYNF